MQKETSSKEYTKFFFKTADGEDKISVCTFCDKRLAKDNGYSNLMSHLTKQHPDYVKIYEVQNGRSDTSSSTLDKMWQASEDAKKNYFWMKKVVFHLRREPGRTRGTMLTITIRFNFNLSLTIFIQGVNFKGISVATLKKYITLVQSYIIHQTIKPELEKAKCLGLSMTAGLKGVSTTGSLRHFHETRCPQSRPCYSSPS